MATEVERLIFRLEATQAKFEKQLARANQTADKRARAIEARFAKMNKTISAGATRLGGALGAAFLSGSAVRGAQQLIDAATRIENALKVAGLSGRELTSVYDTLFESAQRNAAPMEALVELYSRASLVQKELGVSTQELLGFTDRVALALRVSGQSAAESSGALLQLSQALGSGIVRAEEFNSILEGALPIAQAAAAGLEEAGGSVAKLRELVVDGKVTSEAFFRAFEAGAVILEQKVAGAELTVSQGFVRLNNALIKVAGRMDDATGASEKTGVALDRLAGAVEALGDFMVRVANGPLGQFIGKLAELDAIAEKIVNTLAAFSFNDEIVGAVGDVIAPQAQLTEQAIKDFATRNNIGPQVRTTEKTGRVTAAPETVSLSDFAAPAKRGGGGGGGSRRRGGGSRQNNLQREIEMIKERTASLQAMTAAQATVNPLIDDYGFALERATTIAELENAAKKAGLEITPQLSEQIRQLATAYATATVESEKLAESQDNARQQADDLKDLGKDVLGGFINDLRNGVDAAEALEGALQKVADKLLDMALNNLIAGLFGGGFGGGGLLSLFGFAKGGIAAHGKPQPLPRFAKGGVARSASIFGEAGPEAAVPLPDGRRIPVDLRGPSASGSRGTSINMPVTIDARDANAPALARVNERLREMQRNLPREIDNRINTRDVRGTRP